MRRKEGKLLQSPSGTCAGIMSASAPQGDKLWGVQASGCGGGGEVAGGKEKRRGRGLPWGKAGAVSFGMRPPAFASSKQQAPSHLALLPQRKETVDAAARAPRAPKPYRPRTPKFQYSSTKNTKRQFQNDIVWDLCRNAMKSSWRAELKPEITFCFPGPAPLSS